MASLASGLMPEARRGLEAALRAQDKYSSDVAQALGGALVVGDTLRVFTPFTAAAPLVVPSDEKQLTSLNAFVDVNGNFCRKNSVGEVWLSVSAKSGTLTTAVCQLPVGYRPGRVYTVPAVGDNAFADCDIQTGGNVVFFAGTDVNNLSFVAKFPCSDNSPYVPSCFPFDVLWPLPAAPTLILAQCMDARAGSPSNLSASLTDWTTTTKGGRTFIHVRNIPGLLPNTNYSVNLVCF